MSRIKHLSALEILDSRGRPTIQATCQFDDGAVATASVPSGASRGDAEAYELRDGDPKRYNGMGCLRAVANIDGEIQQSLAAREFPTQQSLDKALIELDGTQTSLALVATRCWLYRSLLRALKLPSDRFRSINTSPTCLARRLNSSHAQR